MSNAKSKWTLTHKTREIILTIEKWLSCGEFQALCGIGKIRQPNQPIGQLPAIKLDQDNFTHGFSEFHIKI